MSEKPKEIFSFIRSKRKCSFMNFPLMPHELPLPDVLGHQNMKVVRRQIEKNLQDGP